MKLTIQKKCILSVSAFVLAICTISYAENYDALTPLLIDIRGWTAEKPEGMSMDMGGMKMINATRTYTKEDQRVNAVIHVGAQAMAMGSMQDMEMETSENKVESKEMDGFRVQMVVDKKDKSANIVILLMHQQDTGAIFTLSGEGLSEQEVLDLAKKFNWKKMKAAAEKL